MQSRDGLARQAGRDVTVLEQLGPPVWTTRAACRDSHLDFFVKKVTQRHRQLCDRCAVRAECLIVGLRPARRHDTSGVFGGLTPLERRELRDLANGRTPAETARAFLDGELGTVRRDPPQTSFSRLDGETWATIRRLYRSGTPQTRLAEQYGIAQSQVSAMCAREE